MEKQDLEIPVREDYPLAPEEYPQPLPETEFRQPDGRAEDAAPPGEDYVNPDEKAEFSPPGYGRKEASVPSGRKRRLRRLLYAAVALVLLGLLFGRRGGDAIPAAAVVSTDEPVYTSSSDVPLPTAVPSDEPSPSPEPTPEPLGREPVVETDFFYFSHEHHARIRLSNTGALHSVRVEVREELLDKQVYEHYLSEEEISAGGFELPILSTGDLYMENMKAYDAVHGWPKFEMTVTAWYENEAGDGEDTLTLTREPDDEMGYSVSYLRPDNTWSEVVPPDSFYVSPYEDTTEIRYLINDPDAVTDPLTCSVDLSWNGRHAAPEDYEEVVEKHEYTRIHSDGTETPEVSYTKLLVLRRPDWMPAEGTLHVHIVQRLAGTGELWVRDYDFDYPIRYDWES
ncbi:MAG: hypothetical protein IJQ43_00205 [Oscillospiraceae bacterium]|nr:hypothetical protein [Oscillospiraceae bacterium]